MEPSTHRKAQEIERQNNKGARNRIRWRGRVCMCVCNSGYLKRFLVEEHGQSVLGRHVLHHAARNHVLIGGHVGQREDGRQFVLARRDLWRVGGEKVKGEGENERY